MPRPLLSFRHAVCTGSFDLAGRVTRVRVDASEGGSDHQALMVELDWGA
ncbi:hypothetical protein [uncultured Massilia sp.]|nr:hypothetical protein [uncultured Massilia sp.]